MAADWELAIEEIKNRWTVGALEAIPAIGSMIAAEPIAGYAGLVSSPYTGSRAGSVVDSVRGSATYQPRTKEGQSILRGAANGLGWVMDKAKMVPAGYAGMYQLAAGRGLGDAVDTMANVRGADYSQTLGDATFETTGSPALAAAAYSIPTAISEGVGLKGAGRLKGTALEIGDIGSQGYSKQKGIFAGVKAKNADLDAMKAAQELADRGVGRDEIWKNTGWFKDGDGSWKWEIDDSQLSLNVDALKDSEHGFKVAGSDVLNHRELKSAYKELDDNLTVSFENKLESDGSYRSIPASESMGWEREHFIRIKDPAKAISNINEQINGWVDNIGEWTKPSYAEEYAKKYGISASEAAADIAEDLDVITENIKKAQSYGGKIELYASTPSVMTHELQHGVQKIEGHSPGGSQLDQSSYDKWMHNKEFYRAELGGIRSKMSKEPEYTRLQMDAARAKDIDSARAAAVKVKEFENSYPGYADAAGEFNRAVEYTKYTPHEKYLRIGGEAEARNAQTRMDYSPEKRRQTPPWETLDVPESEISY